VTAVILQVLFSSVVTAGLWLYVPDEARADLEARYASPPSTFVQAEGVRVHLRDTGKRDGPAIFMLHGFGASLHTWEAWAQALSADYRVIRFDLPGFGLTGTDPTGDYTDARAIQVLAALMDRLRVRRAILIGNSMGGRIALEFAASHPARVSRLVLISPDGFASPGLAYTLAAEAPVTVGLLPYLLPAPLLRMHIAAAYGDPQRLTEEVVARYRDMILAPGVRAAVLPRMEQMVAQNPGPLLRRVHVPVLLLWGEKDGMIPISCAAGFLAALPDARLVALPGLGHVPQEESPAEALEPVRNFLAR
jgi:pimeloyl-ACP methyl ester carboxylesterase